MLDSDEASGEKRPKRGLFRSLRTKLIVYFCAVSISILLVVQLVTVAGVPFTPYRGRRGQQRTEAFRSMSLIADMKKERLMRWLKERHDDGRAWSESLLLRDPVSQLHTAIQDFMAEGKQGDALWASVREETAYQKLVMALENLRNAYGVYRIIQIASAQSGEVFVSTEGTDLGMDISKMPVFPEAMGLGEGAVSDIEFDEQVPFFHFHLAHPIRDLEGKTVAGLMLTVDLEDIVRPMLHTGEGLGTRGEALLVNPDNRIVTSLKHPLPDGSVARPLQYQTKAEPATLAARGEEGIIETDDYRAVPVLAAYRHIPMGRDWGWGLVVKRDRAELFAPIRQDLLYTALIGGLAVLVTILLTSMLASSLTRPIHSLIGSARSVQDGDLATQSSVTTSDDVGMLATTFNSMVQHIKRWRETLEGQVMARTADLNQAMEELEVEVAERQAAESKLRQQNEFLNNVVESLTHPFYVIDANDYTVEMANSATSEQTVTRGMTCYALGHHRTEPCGHTCACPLEDVKKTRKPVVVEHTHFDRDGNASNYEVHGYPILDRDGKVVQMIEYCLDVTERKKAEHALRESEERFRQLAENIDEVFWVGSADSRELLYVSPAYERVWGRSCRSLYEEPSSWLDAVVEEDRERVIAGMKEREAVDYSEPGVEEYRIRRPDGVIRWILVRISPIRNEQGEAYRLAGIASDVTERKRTEEIENVSRRFLDIANRHTSFRPLLEAFVAGIKSLVGCEAVGVRVLDAEGYIPYEAFDGFSEDLRKTESSLSVKTDRCMCILVIKGETDPSLPFFSEAGSFYINGTSRFLATASEEVEGDYRNVCNEEGYESVALIPVKLGDQILGLIHVADSREEMFPLELVKMLEAVGVQLGPAVQRVWVEEALRKREEQYRKLVEGSRDLVWRLDREGRFTFVNPAAEPMLGYAPGELVGESFEKVLAEESLEEARGSWGRRLRGELPRVGITIEFAHRRRDGRVFVGESRTSPIYGENGELIEVEGVTRDVTERKQAEEKLAWDAAVNNALSNLYKPLVSPSAAIEEIAHTILEEARNLTGSAHGYVGSIDPETGDLASHTPSDMLEPCTVRPENQRVRFPPDENGFYPGLWGRSLNTKEAFAANEPETHSASTGLPDGHVRIRRFLSVPVLLGDELVGQIALANKEVDYTDRDLEAVGRLAEYYALAIQHQRAGRSILEERDKAKTYLDIAGVMLIALDANQRVKLVNRRGCEILGRSEEEVLGRNWFDSFIPPSDRDRIRHCFERLMEGDLEPFRYYENTLMTQRGEERLIAWSNTLLRDADGRIIGTLSSGEDITERKIAEEKIRQSLEEKEVLLRELYHRVKNNLQVVCSLLRLQSQTIEDRAAKRAFEESQNRVRSIALVHEKLYKSRNLANISFRDYVVGLTQSLMRAHMGDSSHIALNTHVENVSLDLSIAVPCALLINELLSNALDHAFPGGRKGEVEIALRTDDDQIELVVHDNGVGLPEAFDYRKTGSLGLRLVVTLAEKQLNGSVEHIRTHGTKFRIRFPKPHIAEEV